MLTKELLFKKNPKYKSLDDIQTINLWGSEINDISILSQCRNLEIVSLSLNNISNISPLKKCIKLRELYLRKNKICSLSQIDYLKNLKDLRILWLDENPISNLENYKEYILKNLPQLIKFDNVPIINREIKKFKTTKKSNNKRTSYINEKKYLLRRVNSNEPIQLNLLMTLKGKNNNPNISNNSNSSIIKFNNIVSNGSFSDLGDILKQRSNSNNKIKSIFKKLKLKIKTNKEEKKSKIKIINNNHLHNETLSPKNNCNRKENIQIKISNYHINSNKEIVRNKTSINSLINSSDISSLNNEHEERLYITNNLKKTITNEKNIIKEAMYLINKMDINDLIYMKKKIEEKIKFKKKNL